MTLTDRCLLGSEVKNSTAVKNEAEKETCNGFCLGDEKTVKETDGKGDGGRKKIKQLEKVREKTGDEVKERGKKK